MTAGGTRPWPAPADAQRCPTGIAVAAGAVAVVAAAVLAAALAGTPSPRLGLLTAVVLVFTALAGDGRAALAVAGIAWAVGNGFLVNRLGELSWHGRIDAWFVTGLLVAVSVGMVVAQARRERVARRRWRPFAALLDETAGAVEAGADPGARWRADEPAGSEPATRRES